MRDSSIDQDTELAQSFGKEGTTRVITGSSPGVVKLIATDNRDLVFGVHQSFVPPEATSPTPR